MPLNAALKYLRKKAKHGFRGRPMAFLAYYGPDDRRATKVVVTVQFELNERPIEKGTWLSTDGDAREDPAIAEEIRRFVMARVVRTVSIPERIYGCPHEAGVDYEGETCPACLFWANREPVTGKKRV